MRLFTPLFNKESKSLFAPVLIVFLLLASSLVNAQSGYIYVHKKSLNEIDEDFSFSVTGGSTSVPTFILNDAPTQIPVLDLGAAENGRLWAASRTNVLYYRDVNSTVWINTGVTGVAKIDGGPGGTCFYINTAGTVFSYDGIVAPVAISTVGQFANAGGFNDIGSGWTGTPTAGSPSGPALYVVRDNAIVYKWSGTGSTWNTYSTITGFAGYRVDVNPTNGNVYVAGNTSGPTVRTIREITPALVQSNLGGPVPILASFRDLAVNQNGELYITAFVNQWYVSKYVSGTTWNTEFGSFDASNITGGVANTLWVTMNSGGHNGAFSAFYNIFSRGFNGIEPIYIDDERVRTTVGNSQLIPVAPGTYTITETEAAGWDLQKILLYDPSSNSTSDQEAGIANINVSAGEVVHVVFQNGELNPIVMTNSCNTAYLEDFGSGPVGTYGNPVAGQTSYHYLTNDAPGEDGYYKIVNRANPDFNTWLAAAGIVDHTSGDSTFGYMYAVNAGFDKGEFFRRRFTGVVPGATYNFSAWIVDLTADAPVNPNVSFSVYDHATQVLLGTYNTGELTNSTIPGTWQEYGFTFLASASDIDLVVGNNGIGGPGNDLAIDDISFLMIPPTTPVTSVANSGCGTLGSITVTSPVGPSYVYTLDTSIANSWQSSVNFNNLTPGTYTVFARFLDVVDCISSKLDTVELIFAVNAGTDGNTSVCDNTTPLITLADFLSGEQLGGVWSRITGTGGTFNAGAGTYTPAVGATTSTFRYIVTGTTPCPNDTSFVTVNIYAPANAGTDGNISVCDNSTTSIDLFSLIGGEQSGGAWTRLTGTGGTFNAVAGTFVPAAGATTSTFQYLITGTAPCANDASVATVNITPQANAGTDGNISVCDNSTTSIDLFSLIGGEQSGGAWTRLTGTGGTFNAVAGTFVPAAGATTSTFQYLITGTAPCANDASVATVNITPQANAGTDGNISVCDNSTTSIDLFSLIGGEQSGGAWTRLTGTEGTFNSVAGTFVPAVGATTSTFQYLITGTAPCANDASVATVNITPQANAGTDGNISVCDNSTTSIDLFSLIGGEQSGGAWTRLTGTGGTFNAVAGTFVPAAGATTSTFQYVITGTAPCANDASVATVNITPQANAGTDGNISVCDNSSSTITLANLITGEQSGGAWTRLTGTGGTFNAVTGTFVPAAGATTSTFQYLITGTVPCANDASVATVNITPQANAGTDGNISVCDNSTTSIDLFSLIGGEQSGGAWTRLTGTGGTFNAVAGTFVPAAGATTSTFQYLITGTAPCANDASVATVSITPQANAGSNGSTSICDNSTEIITLANLITGEQTGGVWSRVSGSGGTLISGSYIPAAGATTSTFRYVVTGTAPCVNDTSLVTVNIAPQANAGGDANSSICYVNNQIITLSDFLSGEQSGGAWTRLAGTGGTFNDVAGTFTTAVGVTSSSFQYVVTGISPCLNDTSNVVINLYQNYPTSTQTITICQGDSVCVTNPQSTNRTINPDETICYTTSGTYVDTLISGTANGCDSIVTTILTVVPQANAGADGNISVCDNSSSTITLANLITGEQSGGAWTRLTGTGGTFNAVAGTFVPAAGATTSTFQYLITGTAPCANDASVATVNITPQANAGTDGNISVCDNSTTSIDLFSLIGGEQAGGAWTRLTGTGGTFNAVAGTFVPAAGATTSTFQYLITGTAPCSNDVSVATIQILNSTSFTQNLNLCTGQTITGGTSSYTTPGTYIDTILNAAGCDSVITSIITAANCYVPTANENTSTTQEGIPVTISVLPNDTFGGDGPSTGTITVTEQPSNGNATVNDNGTPNDPTDDQIVYTPNPNFTGTDSLIYQICDSNGDCDTALVVITIDSTYIPNCTVNGIVLDDFESTSTVGVAVSSGSTIASSTSSGGGIVGGERDIVYTISSAATPTPSNTYEVLPDNGGEMLISTGSGYTINGFVVTYDGLDGIAAGVDATSGLGGLNLLGTGGFSTNLKWDGISAGKTLSLMYRVYSDATHYSDGVVTFNGPLAGGTNYPANLLSSSFVLGTGAAGLADFSSINAIQVIVSSNQAGIDLTIMDGITVPCANYFPTANADTETTNEDTPVTIDVLNNDTFGGDGPSTGTITVTEQPTNGTVTVDDNGTPNDPTDDELVYTPNPNFNGSDTLIYQICDANNDCDTALVVITITPVDDAPIANADTETTTEDTPLTSTVVPNDVLSGDGGNVFNNACPLCTSTSNGTLVFNSDGTYTYTPNANFNGTDEFIYQLCDVDGDCDTAIVTITINSTNDVPTANADTETTNEDTPVTIEVLTNDTFGGDGPSTGTITVTEQPSNGTVTVDDNGTPNDPTDDELVYTPNPNFNGSDTLIYQICDANNDCDTALVVITITPVDDAPIANADTETTTEDTPLTSTVVPNDVLSGDGGNVFNNACPLCTSTSNGTLVFNSDGTYTYTPNANFNGTDEFIYQLCDVDGDCDTAIVTITINSTNDVPTANADTETTNEDTPVTIDVLNNDTFGGDGPSTGTITVTEQPTNGTVTVEDNGTPNDPTDDELVYTPNPNFNGSDTLIYQICDANNDCDTALVVITITPVDDAPIANADTETTTEDTPLTSTVVPNDVLSGDGGNVFNNACPLCTSTSNGTLVFNSDGTYTYTPNANFNGTDEFIYQLCDVDGDCDTAIVTITINSTNDVPTANADTETTNEDTPVTIEVLTNDTFGGDGPSTGTITVTEQPSNGTVTVDDNGTPNDPTDDELVYTPNPNFNGSDTLIYQICDANNDCDTALVVITITPVDDAPIANADTETTTEDTPLTSTVVPNDVLSGDGGNVFNNACPLCTSTSNGTLVFNSDGTYTYTPNANFNGTDEFIYQLCDVDGDCDTAIVTITINSTNDVPTANADTETTNEDTPVTIDVLNNDTFGGDGPSTGTITVTEQPTNGTVTVEDNGTPNDPTDDELVYTPNPNFNGSDTLIYQICDANNDCDTALVVITITPVDDAPIANADTETTTEDTPLTSTVVPNDVLSGDGGNVFNNACPLCTSTSNGTLVFNSDGTYTYTPNANFNGTDEFIYQLCDVDGDCDTAIVTITINSTNDVPTANADTETTNEDTPVTIEVLTNDTFGGDGPSTGTITVTEQPSNGTVTVDDNGTPNDPTDDELVYTPNPNFNGSDTLIYQICDANNDCDTALVVITINPVNDPPVIGDTSVVIPQDSTITVCVPFTDIDIADTHTASLACGPFNGITTALIINGTEICITYTPDNGYAGLDSICVVVCDNGGLCDTGIITITVVPPTDTIVDTICTTCIDTLCLDNPFGPGSLVTTTLCDGSTSTSGTVIETTILANGCIEYTATGVVGRDTVCVVQCDAVSGLCDTTIIVVTVPPTPDTIEVTVPTDSVITVCVTLESGFDPATTTYTYCDGSTGTLAGTLGTAVLDASGCVTYNAGSVSGVEEDICVIACDATTGFCDTTIITITVVPPTDTIVDTICTTCIDTLCLDNPFGPGSLVTTTLCDGSTSTSGTVIETTILANGCIEYTATGVVGRDTVCVVQCDAVSGLCDTTIIVVTVPPTPDTIEVTVPTDSVITVCVTLESGFDPATTTYTYCDGSTGTLAGTLGTAVLDASGCVTYNAGSVSGVEEDICVIACDATTGFCDTTIITITVVPPTDTIVDTICTTCIDTLCLDNPFGPGSLVTTTLCDGSTSTSGTVIETTILANGCIEYTATGVVGRDTVCVVQCDAVSGLCDTTIIVVTVPPTPDTIEVTVPTDSVITVCVTLESGFDPATTTYTYCDGSTGTLAGTLGTAVLDASGCVTYNAGSVSGVEEDICVIACDATTGFCDTTIITITVVPPTDTIVDTICTTCIDTLCLDNPFGPGSLVTTTLCDGSTSTSGTVIETTILANGCIEYTATGVVGRDTVCVVQCDAVSGLCDTTIIVVTVPPTPDTIEVTVPTDSVITVCVTLESGFDPATTTYTYCDGSTGTLAGTLGTAVLDASGCVTYNAGSVSGVEEDICVIACDATTGFCDTTIITITVVPPTDTIVDTICTTCIDTLCLDNPFGPGSLVTTTLCDGSTSTSGTVIETTILANGCIEYTATGVVGRDTVCVVQCDAVSGLCDTTIIVVTVPPTPDTIEVTVPTDSVITVCVTLESGFDPATTTYTYCDGSTGTLAGTLGTAVLDASGCVTYNAGSVSGVEEDICVIACDATTGFCDTTIITITVVPPTDTIVDTICTTCIDTLCLDNPFGPGSLVTTTLCDGSTSTSGTVIETTILANGCIEYTATGVVGRDTVCVVQCDAVSGLCDTTIIVVTVPPTPDTIEVTVPTDSVITVCVTLESGFDPATTTYTYCDGSTGTLAGTLGTAVLDASGCVTYNAGSVSGVEEDICVIACDATTGFCDTTIITITVVPPTDTIVDTICTTCIDTLCLDNPFGPGSLVTTTLCDGSTSTSGTVIETTILANGCIEYTATGVVGRDTVCVVQCDAVSGLCDTTIIVVTVPPTPDTIEVTVPTDSVITVCVTLESGFDPATTTYTYCDGSTGTLAGTLGTAVLDASGCVTYNAGSVSGVEEDICVIACDATTGFCDTTIITITVVPPTDTIVDTICTTCIDTLCLDNPFGPGSLVTTTLCDGSTSTSGTVIETTILANGCIEYTATGVVGRDTVCVVQCDAVSGLCDTTIIVVTVPPTPDTIEVTVPTDSVITVCVTLESGFDPATTTYTYCDGSTGTLAGTLGTAVLDASGCVTYNAGSVSGVEEDICVIACDATTGFCDTTIITITVVPPTDTIVDTICTTCIDTLCLDNPFGPGSLVTTTLCDGSTSTSGTVIETTILANGCIEYTATGVVGRDTVCVVQCDAVSGLCDTTIIVVTVPPTPDTIEVTVPTDSVITVCVTLESGFDPATTTYTYCDGSTGTLAGTLGTAVLDASGCVTYNAGSVSGVEEDICVIACDATTGFCDTTIITITVVPPTDTIVDTICTTCIDTLCLDNPFGPGSLVTTTLCDGSTSTSGTVIETTILANGCIEYTATGVVGRDTVCVVQCDAVSGLCDTTIIVVTVPPTPDTIEVTVPTDSVITVCVTLESGFDPATTTYTYCDGSTGTLAGTLGTAVLDASGCVTYNAGSVSGVEEDICVIACDATTGFCDTTIIIIEIECRPYAISIEATSCNPADTGTVVTVLMGANGCDSTVTTVTTLAPYASSTVNATTCDVNEVGTTVDTIVGGSSNGCDSIINTITTLLPSSATTINLTTCEASEAGTVVDTLSGTNGCDSIVTTITTLLPSTSVTLDVTSCNPADTGTVVTVLMGANGCDSTVTTVTTLAPYASSTVNATTCDVNEVGTTVDTIVGGSSNGCDSIITTITTLLPSSATTINLTTCEASEAGTVVDTLSGTNGCDSIVTTITTLLPSTSVTLDVTSCNPADTGTVVTVLMGANGCDSTVTTVTTLAPYASSTVNATTCDVNEVGTTVDTIVGGSSNGCDSIITTITTLLPSSATTINLTTCEASEAGTVVDTLSGTNGCDSIVTTITTLLPSTSVTLDVTSCNPADTGTVVTVLMGANGCDSTVTTVTTLAPYASSTVNATTCDVNEVGTTVDTIVGGSSNGCDSIITTITTLLPSSATTINLTTCEASEAGTVVDTLSGTNGCDSIVTTITTLLPSTSVTLDVTSCNPADTGTVVTVLMGANGCDSTVTTVTTLAPYASSTVNATTCDVNEVGTTVDTIVGGSSNGCDSIITTITTLLPSSATTINLTTCEASEAGTVVDTLSGTNGCDSIVTTITTLLPSTSVTLDVTSCNPADTGTVVTVLMGANGCDSTVTTVTTLAPYASSTVNATTCDVNEVGTTVDTIVGGSSNGCDSIITTITTLLPSSATTINLTTCEASEAGTVVDTLSGTNGCDSIVTTITTLLPSTSVTLDVTSCNPADTGTVVTVLMGANGCDSVVTTITTLLPSYSITVTNEVCNPADSGIVVVNLTTLDGCDSLITLVNLLVDGYIELPDTAYGVCTDPINQVGEYCIPIGFADFISGYELLIDGEVYFDLPFICDVDSVGGYNFTSLINSNPPSYGGSTHILLSWEVNDVELVNAPYTYSTFTELASYLTSVDPQGNWAANVNGIDGGFPNSNSDYGTMSIFSPEIGAQAFVNYNSGFIGNGTLIEDVPAGCHWFTIVNVENPACTDSIYVCIECVTPAITTDTIYLTIPVDESTGVLCGTGNDIENIESSESLGCDVVLLEGSIVSTDANGCVIYNAGDIPGNFADTLCVVAIDSLGNTDTTVYVISVIPNTDTIITPPDTVCIDFVTTVGGTIDTVYSCDGDAINVITDTLGCEIAIDLSGIVDGDTICVVACSGEICDTTIIIVTPELPTTDTIYLTIPVDESTGVLCGTGNDIENIESSESLGCDVVLLEGSIVSTDANGCVIYNAGDIPGNFADTLCVVAIDSLGNTDTTVYVISVIPNTDTIITPPDTVCIDFVTTVGGTIDTVYSCDGDAINVITDTLGCEIAIDLSGIVDGDTICVVVCSAITCDTTIIIVTPAPPTPDTIEVVIPTDTIITVCVELEDSFDPNTTTYTYCDGSTGTVNGAIGSLTLDEDGCLTYTSSIIPGNEDTICVIACDSVLGACDTTIIVITVVDSADCFIPNSFSPNIDGNFDNFEIECAGEFPELELFVYNRWGDQVYYSGLGYQNDWNGTWDKKNVLLPDGTYYWIVKFNDGLTRDRAGYVTILR
jgi:gliding motility-associated-like protein